MIKKFFYNTLIIVFINFFFVFYSVSLYAVEEKGALIKLWENFTKKEVATEKKVQTKKKKFNSSFKEKKESDFIKTKKTDNIKKQQQRKTVKLSKLDPKIKIVEDINKYLDSYPEILEILTGLSKKESIMDAQMHYFYSYESNLPKRLIDIDKNILEQLRLEIVLQMKKIKRRKSHNKIEKNKRIKGQEKQIEMPERLQLTKEEMIEVIKRRLEIYGQIAYIIPNFFIEQDENQNNKYLYKIEEEVFELEQLDRYTLYSIYVKVNNEASIIQTQRVMMQIQQQSQLVRTQQQIQQQQSYQRLMNAQPTVPRVYNVPQPVKQPPIPPMPPKTQGQNR